MKINILLILLMTLMSFNASAYGLSKNSDGSFQITDICVDSTFFGLPPCNSARKCAIKRVLDTCNENFKSKEICQKKNVKTKKISLGRRGEGMGFSSIACKYSAIMNISLD